MLKSLLLGENRPLEHDDDRLTYSLVRFFFIRIQIMNIRDKNEEFIF